MKKLYHIGEILRLGLLKAMDGTAYTSKITVSKIVNSERWEAVKTKYGAGKALTMAQIEKLNKRWD